MHRRDRINQINAAQWDSIVDEKPFSSHAWLAYGERIHHEDRPVYHISNSRTNDGAACVCWIRQRDQLPIKGNLLRAGIEAFLNKYPLVTCQTAVTGLSGIFIPGTGGRKNVYLKDLANGMKTVLHENHGSFLVIPYLTPDLADHPAWGPGFMTIRMSPGQYLSLEAASFDAYLRSLRPSVRKDYRRHENQLVRLGLKTTIRDTPPGLNTVRRLVRSVERRHQSAPNPWLDALVQTRTVPGGKWICVEHGQTTVGCGLILRDRRHIALTLLGLDGRTPHVYFALMYGAIRHAIETRAEGIFGGGGAEHFKARLGFEPTPNRFVKFYARSRALRRMGAWLARKEAASITIEPSRPFAVGLSEKP